MLFHIHTYGCQMNERDSDAVAAALKAAGHSRAPGEAEAELVIVNTCSVRGKAEDKAVGKLGLLLATKRERPGRLIGAVGCVVQRMGTAIFEHLPRLDFAIGTHALSRVPAAVERIQIEGGQVLDTGGSPDEVGALAAHFDPGISAFVNILLGCDRCCAYCIVPQTRGREWSRPAEAILAEVATLAAAGTREVTLLGQSVMSYGRANSVWPEAYRSPLGFVEPLPRLLEAVAAVPGIRRVRFTSGHPSGCTEELARAMGYLPAVCPHLHIPVQSGSDRILTLMRRGYTVADYRAAVARLRAQVPEIGITTDIIVGFPTETDADYAATVALTREIGFDNAFIFKYSPRAGTEAAGWSDDVPDDVKLARNRDLLAIQDRIALERNQAQVGRTLDVLVEGASLRNAARWAGRSGGNRIVVFEPDTGTRKGDLARVRIERAMAQSLYGVLADTVSTGDAQGRMAKA